MRLLVCRLFKEWKGRIDQRIRDNLRIGMEETSIIHKKMMCKNDLRPNDQYTHTHTRIESGNLWAARSSELRAG